MSALLDVPFLVANSLSDLCLLMICPEPNELEAARFSDDIVVIAFY